MGNAWQTRSGNQYPYTGKPGCMPYPHLPVVHDMLHLRHVVVAYKIQAGVARIKLAIAKVVDLWRWVGQMDGLGSRIRGVVSRYRAATLYPPTD